MNDRVGPRATVTAASVARIAVPRRESPPGPRKPRVDELDEVAHAAAALAARPSGGPLGLHAASVASAAPGRGVATIDGVADRMLVGRTREGHAEVRLELGAPGWRGTEVRLVAGAHGLEATLVVASEAARRVVEGRLAELARTLEDQGLRVASCRIVARADAERDRDDARQRRRDRAEVHER